MARGRRRNTCLGRWAWTRLARQPEGPIHILEVGLGTGLNVLDAWVRARCQSTGGRPKPRTQALELGTWPLGHAALTEVPEEVLQNIVAGRHVDGHMDFTRIDAGVMDAALEGAGPTCVLRRLRPWRHNLNCGPFL